MLPSEFVKSQKENIRSIVILAIAVIIQSFASIFFPQIVQQLNERFHDLYLVSFSFLAFLILGACARMNNNCNKMQEDINQK